MGALFLWIEKMREKATEDLVMMLNEFVVY